MTTLALERPPARGWSLGDFLRQELAPFPGRLDALWRFLICSAIVVTCSMTLQVPFLAFSLIMMCFTAQENTVLTKLAGVMLVIGIGLAVALSILLFKFTMGYPMWRVLGACAIGFAGMYFFRLGKLGVVGFQVAMFVVYAQSLVDIVDQPEMLTRSMLWVWVAGSYPIVLTVLVNQLFRPPYPVRLLTDEMLRRLAAVNRQLEARRTGSATPGPGADAVERGVLVLHRHLTFATQGDAAYGCERGRHLMRIAAIDRLHAAAAHLASWPAQTPTPAQPEQLQRVQASCAALAAALAEGAAFTQPPALPDASSDEDGLARILREMAHALHAFAEADASPPPDIPIARERLFAADAFSNPAYGRFAFKTVLAAMLCYGFYTAVQWPGIHTSMLTCIILALPSLGATTHKGLTRVVGCAIGSLIALAATVFVIPHLDGIVGLLGLTLPVIALAAWVAAGSARTNYVGVQIVFAFALSLLGHFGPTTDVTEIRDRMLGILLGLAVTLTISTLLWPERDSDALKATLGRLLQAIAGLVRAGAGSAADAAARAAIDQARLQSWSLLSQNRELQARVALESGWQHAHDSVTANLTSWLAQAQEMLLAVDYLQVQLRHARTNLTPQVAAALDRFCTLVAGHLERLADDAVEAGAQDAPRAGKDMADLASLLAQLPQHETRDPERKVASAAPLAALFAAVRAVHERVVQLAGPRPSEALPTSPR